MINQKTLLGLGGFIIIILFVFVVFLIQAGAPKEEALSERFVVAQGAEKDEAVEKLYREGFIKSPFIFTMIHRGSIQPGGYALSKSMSAFAVSDVIDSGPYMKWVVIPEGFRKEQIAEVLASALEWSDAEVREFISTDTETLADIPEGVFFPDTYLIEERESTKAVAERLHNRFNENFKPFLKEANRQNIRWPTLVNIAALVQREAAGEEDMAIIAGIFWNRLLNDMRLQADATVQYVRDTYENYSFDNSCAEKEPWQCPNWVTTYTGKGAEEHGWWREIHVDDKSLTPFNTYRKKGLPERPIANPGSSAIKAVLFPAETSCFYYIHDSDGNIHCSETLEEHEEAIERFLR